jgi:hypothetical protein
MSWSLRQTRGGSSERHDAIAVEITASLFGLRIESGLSSMDATSYSITAKPWKCQHTPRVHLAYVYEQETKDPSVTDEERHMGAADLVFEPQNLDALNGVYWTRRSWITGLNTAGRLQLHRVATAKDPKKTHNKVYVKKCDLLNDWPEILRPPLGSEIRA